VRGSSAIFIPIALQADRECDRKTL